MKLKIILQWTVVFLGFWSMATLVSAQETVAIKTTMDKVSYGVGVDTARNLKSQGVKVDVDNLTKNLRDEFAGKKPFISDKELRKQVTMFIDVINNVKNEGKVEVNLDLVINGFKDEFSGKKLRIPDRELRRLMTRVKANLKNN